MTELHPSIRHLEMPAKMKHLPLTENGFPVLYFAAVVNGKPDLRVMAPEKLVICIERKLCWICGQPLGRYMAFVLGPMCCITRTTAEPPTHLECAKYAVRACPFLVRPRMHRSDAGLPADKVMAGFGIERNPGVAAIWVTRSYRPFRPHTGGQGILIQVGDPVGIEWWTEGRPATYVDVTRSVEQGAPALFQLRHKDDDPDDSLRDLNRMFAQFLPLLRNLPGREEKRPDPETEAAMASARADEVAWFRLHPAEESYIRPLLPGEFPGAGKPTHARVTRLDAAGDLRQREFGRLVGGQFQVHSDAAG